MLICAELWLKMDCKIEMDISDKMEVGISPELSRRFGVFGFICAVLIVLIHAMPRPSTDTWQWWVANLMGAEGLCRVAVPFFFFISGFFLSRHIYEDGWVRRELCKRVKTLVIPYFIWIAIGIFFSFIFWFAAQKSGRECGVPNPFYGPVSLWVANVLGINPFRNSIGVLWYLRDLFVLVALSPVLVFVLRHFGWSFVLFLYVVYGAVSVLLTGAAKMWFNFFEYFFSVRGLCYFTIGMFFRFVPSRFAADYSVILTGVGLVMCFMKVVLMRFGFLEWSAIFDVVMVPILGIGLFGVFRRVSLPKWLVGNAFPVYLLHVIFVKVSVVVIVALGIRDTMDGSIVVWMARGLFAVGLSIGSAAIVKKYLPHMSELLFGGR